MVDLPALCSLLSGWFIGPLYGANVVVAAIIVRKLWSRRTDIVSQALMLIAAFFISSCTAHAFIYLDDLVVGFTSPHDKADHSRIDLHNDPLFNGYFASARFNFIACFFLYAFNTFFNNTFIVWRVYVIWRRNAYLAAFLSIFHIAAFVVALFCASHMVHKNTLWDPMIKALLASTFALSMAIQISGALLIGWHTMKTPKVVNDDDKPNLGRNLFFAFVESGSLALVVELLGIVFLYRNWWLDWIFIAVLAQTSALSSLGIILREVYKAEHELSNGFANVTSALVMQMPGYKVPHYSAHHSTNSSDDGEAHDNAVMVAIETSRLDDSDAQPRFPSPDLEKLAILSSNL